MKYLGITPKKPVIGVFDFTGCEGCELQLVNKEDSLVDFLNSIEIVNHREVTSKKEDNYEIAFIDGAISRDDEVKRLKKIRAQASILVAMGSCACFGGVNRLKNSYDLKKANETVYGNKPKKTSLVKAVKEVVKVDLEIPGCPVNKSEIESIVQHVIWDVPFEFPVYPVCFECKQQYTTCRFEKGELCLGSVTKAGCKAPCPKGGLGCWGCRGPALDANFKEFFSLSKKNGFTKQQIKERINFFGGFKEVKLP